MNHKDVLLVECVNEDCQFAGVQRQVAPMRYNNWIYQAINPVCASCNQEMKIQGRA